MADNPLDETFLRRHVRRQHAPSRQPGHDFGEIRKSRMLISLREFGRRNRVSHVAIQHAVKAGRLPSTDGKIDPEVAQPVWEQVKGARAGRKAPEVSTLATRVSTEASTRRPEVTSQVSTQPAEVTTGVSTHDGRELDPKVSSEVSNRREVSTQVTRLPVGAIRQSPITISINGAEYLELAKKSEDEGMTLHAYVRWRCGLPSWNSRGREMAGRTSAVKTNIMALDRLAVTIMVTDAERLQLDAGASAVGLFFPQYIRTCCGWQVRQTSLPNTPERDSEEDDAWERLRQLGL
jgi:hypothetical protein